MKYIAPIAVITILLLQFTGAIPQSSVGGPMTLALVFLIAALAVGIHEAWSKKRGVLGWIVNIFAAPIGGFFAASIGSTLMETIIIIMPLNLTGSLAASGHPVYYIALAGMMLITLLGAWIALQVVNRLR